MTRLGMAYNVAVHQPGAWVVCLEGDDEPSIVRQHSYVTAWRTVKVQRRCEVAGKVRLLLHAQDVEVVTVKMDGVRRSTITSSYRLDDPERELLRSALPHGCGLREHIPRSSGSR